AWSWFGSGDKSPEIRSIAVLPLVNMMNDPNQDYFVDGMHEALTAELSKISALRVIGRTSTLSYKVNPKPIPEIAAELNVDAVIEGSVLLAGNKVRITAQLVAARPERHLWADDYVRDMEKILALHKDVAQAIVEEIRVTLTLKEEAILASARPVDPEAYKAYLKGRHFLERLSKEDHDRALDRFNQALNIDPNFAPAYAGIASVYSNLAVAYLPPSEAYPKAKEAAVKAIQLDERLAEAHLILSNILALWEWNWDESRRELDLALELNPNDATTHTYLAIYWLARGNPAEAVRFAQKAQELDPVSAMVSLTLESCYLFNKQYDDAIAQHEITQELSPGFFYLRSRRGIALLEKGLYKEAIRDFDEAERILGRPTTDKAIALARMGRMEEAWEVAREIEATFDNTYHSPVHLAELYVGLGDKERAYTWLNRAVEERAPIIHYLPVFPGFTTIREEQRFKEILKRVGLE
ncbi:MAG: hypothetical protein HQ562_07930, partial [Candidatus Marinimicrobia bacterium]|nr:hypothetical protein [Candidatus Neomarinimicrobiota bacterium]